MILFLYVIAFLGALVALINGDTVALLGGVAILAFGWVAEWRNGR